MSLDIPLNVLVCDSDPVTSDALIEPLRKHQAVASVTYAENLTIAQERLRTGDLNTIFIDPLTPNLDAAADFIFSVRKSLPEIVFVLYMNVAMAEAKRGVFYQG